MDIIYLLAIDPHDFMKGPEMVVRIKKRVEQIILESKKETGWFFSSPRPRKILFEHLPKCGGTTLINYLDAHYPGRKIFGMKGSDAGSSLREFKAYPSEKQKRYDLIRGHLAHRIRNLVHPDCLKVTVLREPVDRIISHYFFAKRNDRHYLHSRIVETDMSLLDYATSDISDELSNWYTYHFSGLSLQESRDIPEKAVEMSLDTLRNQYDLVGFLEEFSSFIEKLRKRANLWLKYDDNRANVSNNRLKIDQVPETTLEKIKELNSFDIMLYEKLKVLEKE